MKIEGRRINVNKNGQSARRFLSELSNLQQLRIGHQCQIYGTPLLRPQDVLDQSTLQVRKFTGDVREEIIACNY